MVPHLTVRMTYNTECNSVKRVCVSRFLRIFCDYLCKFAFPDLHNLCSKHRVHIYSAMNGQNSADPLQTDYKVKIHLAKAISRERGSVVQRSGGMGSETLRLGGARNNGYMRTYNRRYIYNNEHI